VETDMNDQATLGERTPFAIFRKADARPEDGIPIMTRAPMSDAAADGGRRMMEAGIEAGHENRLLFAAGVFSLSYAWFKSFYPLPRHAHDTDCLYYIVAGSLRMGREELGAGDGFFVGAGTPYTYTPGPAGLEILEFRAHGAFDIKLLAGNPAFWDRAVKTVEDNRAAWATERRPSETGA
jgi:mannose-6-phosphate isomerase-like protein (cupin superfamily)